MQKKQQSSKEKAAGIMLGLTGIESHGDRDSSKMSRHVKGTAGSKGWGKFAAVAISARESPSYSDTSSQATAVTGLRAMNMLVQR